MFIIAESLQRQHPFGFNWLKPDTENGNKELYLAMV